MTENNNEKEKPDFHKSGLKEELKEDVKKMESGLKNFVSTSKSFFCSKSSIAIIFALLGIVGALSFQAIAKSRENASLKHEVQALKEWTENFDRMSQREEKILNQIDQDPFLGAKNIFDEMADLEKRMDDIFEYHRQYMKQAFKQAAMTHANVGKANIFVKEDRQNHQYELHFSGFNKEDIAVNIKNNILTFSANQQKEGSNKNTSFDSSSNFYYSFLLPSDYTGKEPEILRENNRIIVKFK